MPEAWATEWARAEASAEPVVKVTDAELARMTA
jgi:hypothetical protein